MKKLIPATILLLSFVMINAQLPEIPNGGFENWENRFLYSKPAVWQTNENPDYAPLTNIRSDDSFEGDYSLRLESILEEKEGQDDRIHFGFAVIAGGEDEESGMPEPAEWLNTADMVHFSVKHSIQPGDGGLIWIMLDYDGENIFQYMEFMEGEQPDWTQVSLPLDAGGGPVDIDGLLIGFTSSVPEGFPGGEDLEPQEGSWVMVDNVYFSLEGTPVDNNIPNGGFEDWQDISPFEPVGWTSTNIYAAAYDTANVTRSTDAYSGSYAARLETVFFDGDDEWGVLSLGDGLWWDGGAMISGDRPYFIGGVYKYEPGNPFSDNQAFLSLNLLLDGDHLSGTNLEFPAAAEYTRFASGMLWYHTEDDPDYMNLTISSANEAGSVLYIDDIEFLHGRQVTFEVEGPGEEPVCCAQIVITGIRPVILADMPNLETDSEGRLTVYLPDGDYTFSIFAPGYAEIIDEPLEINEDMLINETLTPLGFESGEGTEEDPWIIVTPGQLNLVKNYLGWDNGEKHFRLGADIDLGSAPWNIGEGWKPIGDWGDSFHGSFDGAGFVISNLTINRQWQGNNGLFGVIQEADIRNLGLENVNIETGYSSGAIAAVMMQSIVSNSWSSGVITGNNTIGGLTGTMISWSRIHDCLSLVTVVNNSGDNTGGISGHVEDNSEIKRTYSAGEIKGLNNTGGIAGYIGESRIENSYSTAKVSGTSNVGGVAGYLQGSHIDHSYSTGIVSGSSSVGGLVGYRSYETGVAVNSYWNTETSTQSASALGEGRTTAEMILKDTFVEWDFDETEGIWSINEGETYPWLQWQGEAGPHNFPPGLSVIQTHPAEGDNQVPVNTIITVQFDRNIQSGSPGLEAVTLSANSDNTDIEVSISDDQLTVTPASDLDYSTVYSLTVPAGSVAAAADINSTMGSDFILSFITEPDPDAEYLVTIHIDPEESGTVEGEGLIPENGYYTGLYEAGTEVEFTANAAEGYLFGYWIFMDGEDEDIIMDNGDPVGNVLAGPIYPQNIDLIARFKKLYQITVEIVPEGAGTVSAPGMVDGVGHYIEDEQFDLVATANPGYEFEHWYYFKDGAWEIIMDNGEPEGSTLDVEMPDEDLLLRASFISTEPEDLKITFLDDDTDKVYFPGDDFSVRVTISGESIPDGMVTPAVTEGVFDQTMSFTQEPVLEDDATRVVSDIVNNEFTVSGIIRNGVSQGVIGLIFDISGLVTPAIPVIDNSLYDEASGSDFGMAIVGVEIPFGDISADPDLREVENLYDTEQSLDFVRAGHGALQFGEGLNIIDNRAELAGLHEGLRLVSDSEEHVYYVEINPSSLTFLADREATVRIEGYELNSFTIRKTEFGAEADYEAPEDIKANTTAVLADNVLTFSVDGFSRYTVLEKGYTLTLDVNEVGWGTVADLTGEGTYAPGTEVIVEAISEDGYEFLNWSKNGVVVSDQSTFGYIMPSDDVTLTANFGELFVVTFTVIKADDTPVESAVITITQNASEVEILTTGSDGKAKTSLPAGDYGYTVTLVEYEDDSGVFSVTDQGVEIMVTLIHTSVHDPSPSGNRIVVYPNPGDGLFTVEYTGTEASTITLELISIAGNILYVREFYEAEDLKETIDLRHVTRGIYLLRIRENGTVKTIQLVFR